MNENIINDISNELNIKAEQAKTVLKLLEEGNTIPFIARYIIPEIRKIIPVPIRTQFLYSYPNSTQSAEIGQAKYENGSKGNMNVNLFRK